MAYKIIWSNDAEKELVDIISYIKYNTGNITAKKIYAKIRSAVKNISEYTEGRRISPSLKKLGINDIYQINVNPWTIFFKVENKTIMVISIIDERRNLEEILYKKMLDGKIK
jgi:toxin ParE1/3/4